jgi:hypothetical protein
MTQERDQRTLAQAAWFAVAHAMAVAVLGVATEMAVLGYMSWYVYYCEPGLLWRDVGWQAGTFLCGLEVLSGIALLRGREVARKALKVYAICGTLVCANAVGMVLFDRPISMSGSTSPYAYGPLPDEYPFRFEVALASTVIQTVLYGLLWFLVSRRGAIARIKQMTWERGEKRLRLR